VDVFASREDESSAVGDDDVVVEMMSKVGIQAIVDEAAKESSVVGEECTFGCFSP
jgi:3-deoxy-D-manno-octulosonate 8-phosphate phosphatase KdsC-like HAD superfamily phosphatase